MLASFSNKIEDASILFKLERATEKIGIAMIWTAGTVLCKSYDLTVPLMFPFIPSIPKVLSCSKLHHFP